ncbi:hypothetical protein I4U23_015119 [Adineta vaga]|nr:hypothetical protein I4U23_015119 [Adineta vaga]
MANSTDAKKIIRNVGTDKFNIVTGHLASTGANTCVIIIAFFKENNKIFIEHRNDFSDNLNKINMKICLTYVASHIHKLNEPKATISSVYILGGVKKESDIEDKQSLIEKLIKENDVHDLSPYGEMIKNIKLVNAVMNLHTDLPETAGECGISVVINRNRNLTQINLAQYCSNLSEGLAESLIGVMILNPISENIYFAIGNNASNNQGTQAQLYQSNSIAHFQTSMLHVKATELFDDDATNLIKHVTVMEQDVEDSSDDEAMDFGDEFYDP